MRIRNIAALAKLIRYFILVSSTEAGSGHPTSSLSATDLMTGLFFGAFFKFDIKNPQNPNNDRLIFSKGHASPLFYSLWAAAGGIKMEELKSYRKFDSRLEGHPSMEFPFTEVPTGSLGQGLSAGVGMALAAKYLDKLPYKTFVLLGDSEMSEGSVWEAIQIAAYYKLDNLVGILDVNRLGQRGQTMYGHDIKSYADRISAFGWKTILINGHSFVEINKAYQESQGVKGRPVMVIAKTIKGKGISFLENKDGWHGKALSEDELDQALFEIGDVNTSLRGKLPHPEEVRIQKSKVKALSRQINYQKDKPVTTRKAYGNALVRIFSKYPEMVVLDAEVSNSTYSEIFQKTYPDKFFEMFIAEQNMVGVSLGMARCGKIPFVSTFAAFFTRAFDQIRMAQYAKTNIKFVGSHAGVSIGEDGPSQMGLEDISMFRSVMDSVVLYPADAISTEKLVEEAVKHKGIVYIRTTRSQTPILYEGKEKFSIGGSKVLRQTTLDKVTIISAGITLFEALAAYDQLQRVGILVRVIDLYSIKPLDISTLTKALQETQAIITVEDHHLQGGLGEAVSSALSNLGGNIYHLAVKKMPKSGKPQELLVYEEISKESIIKKVKEILDEDKF